MSASSGDSHDLESPGRAPGSWVAVMLMRLGCRVTVIDDYSKDGGLGEV